MLYCKHTFASFHPTHSENQLDQESWINWTCLHHRKLPGTHQLDRHPVWPPWAVGWRQRVTLHGAAFVPVAKAAHCLYLAAGLDGLAVQGNMICGYLWISVVDTTPKKTWTILSQDWGEWAHHFSRLTVGIAWVQGRNPVSWSMFPVCFMRLKQTYNRSTPAFMWKYPNNAMKLQLEEVQECQKRSNKYREYRYWYCRIYNELPQGNLKSEGIQVLTKELMIKLSSYQPISQRHLSFQDLAGQLAGDGSTAGAASVGFYRIGASKIRMVRARTDRQADTHTRTY